MRYRNTAIAALLAPLVVGAGAAQTAHASGFALFTQGSSALGQGNAVTAHANSPNTIFFNPALITKLDGTQFDIGTTVVFSSHDFQSSDTTSTSSDDSIFTPSTFFVTHKFNDTFSAGLGVFNPFGLATDWPEGWEGRYIATKSELTTFNINPVFAVRILPQLSFAAGADIVLLDATLQRKIPSAAFGIPGPAFDINQKFDGDDVGYGFNLAAAYDVTKDLTLGVSYRSEVDVDVDGKSSTSLGGTPFDSKAKTSVTLPAQVTAGIAYRVTEPLIIEAGIRWEGWSSFKELDVTLESGAPVPPTRRNWHDTLGMNVGGRYQVNKTAAVMAGYIYGSNAVPSYTFDPSIPDSDTHIFCLGTDLRFEQFKVAVSYAYQYYVDRTKNNDIGAPFPRANGNYESDAHLLGLELGYRF